MNFSFRKENALPLVMSFKKDDLFSSVICNFRFRIVLSILIDYYTVIRLNIHVLVQKQLSNDSIFSSLAMVLVINSLCYIRVKEMMPPKEAVYISTGPNFMPEAHNTYIRP